MFGKSLSELKPIIASIKSQGLVKTFFKTLTIDDNAIRNYNAEITNAIANGATITQRQQIMRSAMEGTNRATAQLIETTNGAILGEEALADAQNSSTLAAKAHAASLKALSIAGNMIAMWAVSKAISLASSAWNYFNVTVKDVQENVDNLTSNLESLNTELDELSSKNTLTDAEQNRLKYLESRIDLEERLLKIEKTRLAQEQLGDPSKITDWFDDDSYVKKASLEFGEDAVKRPMSFLGALFPQINNLMNLVPMGNNTFAYFNGADAVIKKGNTQYSELEYLNNQYEQLVKERDVFDDESHDWQIRDERVTRIKNELEEYKKRVQSESYADLLEKYGQYTAEAETLKGILNNSAYLSDNEIAYNKKLLDLYSSNAETMKELINNIAISLGDQSLWIGTDLELLNSKTDRLTADTIQRNFTDEEIKILAYLDFDKNASLNTLKSLLAESQGLANDDPLAFSEVLSNESLSKFQSSVKSAADAYTTLLSENCSSSDLLSSIQAINQAASDMGKSIDWESISALDNPLQALQAAIESVSQTYADSVLNGVGIDASGQFGKLLSGIIQEAYRVEAAFDAFNSSIDAVQNSYNTLSSTVEEYNRNGYVTLDTLQSVMEIDNRYISCLMDENGRLILNEEAYKKLTLARLDDARNMVIQEGIQELENIALENSFTASAKAGDAADTHAKKAYNSIDNIKKHTKAVMEDSAALAANNEVLSGGAIDDLEAAYQKALAVNEAAANDIMSAINVKLEFIDSSASNTVSNFGKISNASSAAASSSTETFNWIETILSRIQRTITNLGNTVSATWKSWTQRSSALASELSEVRKEIYLQQSAYDSYMKMAESVGLPDSYKSLVRNGALSVEAIANETLKEQINNYKDWYEKALSCADAVSELKDQLADLAKTRFDSVSTQYNAKIQDIDHVVNMINGELDKAEAQNQIAGESFYKALIEKENIRLETLAREYSDKVSVLNESISTGAVESGSEQWQEMKSDIDSVTESIQSANSQILKYEESIREIARLKFDSLETQYDNAISIIAAEMAQVDKQISLVEEAGYLAGEDFYNALINAEKANAEALAAKYKSLSSSLTEALANGSVKKFDENWYEMARSINDVEDALLDAETALIRYGNSLRELEWDVFDRIQESISGLSEESGFIMDLMSGSNKLHNENGTLNDRGLSVQGLHTVNYDLYMSQAQKYADAIKEINSDLTDDPNNTKLQDRYKELLELQRQAVLNAEDEKSAIKDLISDGYDTLLSYLDKIVSARKKALSEEKNLHDYEKTVSEQAATVNKFQKLLIAYQGDDSEGMKATIQKAQAGLIEAQEALSETEYEQYISDQEALLDSFISNMEEWVNTRLDNINGLMQQAIEATNTNAKTISAQINRDLSEVGMTLTDNFKKIFEIDYSGGVLDIVSAFCGSEGDFSNAMTTLNTAIDEVKTKSGDIKLSTDGINTILTQKLPELKDFIPNLDTTNGKIGDVKNAVDLVKQALETIHIAIADLNSGTVNSTVSPSANSTGASPSTAATTSNTGSNSTSAAASNKSSSQAMKYHLQDADTGAYYLKNSTKDGCNKYISSHNMEVMSTSGNVIKARSKYKTQKTSDQKAAGGRIDGIVQNAMYFYADGVHNAAKNQLAVTQEDGKEIILSPSRGGVLTDIRRGDSVLTAEQSENLYKLSQKSPEELRALFLGEYPVIMSEAMTHKAFAPVSQSISQSNEIMVNMNFPNAKNYDELVSSLQRDSRVEKMFKTAISGALLGKNSYDKFKYTFHG